MKDRLVKVTEEYFVLQLHMHHVVIGGEISVRVSAANMFLTISGT